MPNTIFLTLPFVLLLFSMAVLLGTPDNELLTFKHIAVSS